MYNMTTNELVNLSETTTRLFFDTAKLKQLDGMLNPEMQEALAAAFHNARLVNDAVTAMVESSTEDDDVFDRDEGPEVNFDEIKFNEEGDEIEDDDIPQSIHDFADKFGIRLPDNINGVVVLGDIDIPGFEGTNDVLKRILDTYRLK